MTHLDQVALVRAHVVQQQYTEALRLGRDELARQCDSSELLLLMASAVQLGDGMSGTLDEARMWLERATTGYPQNVDAILDLGHFLDAVADEPQSAVNLFESAVTLSLRYLKDAVAGLASTGTLAPQTRGYVRETLQKALSDLDAEE